MRHVAVCCSVLQCDAVCSVVLQFVAVSYSEFYCVLSQPLLIYIRGCGSWVSVREKNYNVMMIYTYMYIYISPYDIHVYVYVCICIYIYK